MKKLFRFLITAAIIALPGIAYAADSASTVALKNPLGDITDIRLIIARVISAALSLVGSFALLMFVYGGVFWLTSRGETKAIQKGKDTITWAVLGLVIIFSAYVIVNTIISGLTS